MKRTFVLSFRSPKKKIFQITNIYKQIFPDLKNDKEIDDQFIIE